MSGAHRLPFPLFIIAVAIAARLFATVLPSPTPDTHVGFSDEAPYREIGTTCKVSESSFTTDGSENRVICCAGESTESVDLVLEQPGGRPFGTLIGVLFGAELDNHMEDRDRRCARQFLEFAGDGHRMAWRGLDQSVEFWLTPLRTFRSSGGLVCRDFQAALLPRDLATTVSMRTACRQPSGNWLIRN